MTYNVRYGIESDTTDVNSWFKRKQKIGKLIKSYSPSLIGLQEPRKFQLDDLVEMFPHFKIVGSGRDDGMDDGEFSAILFDERLFKLIEENTLWLSDTPNSPSYGWGASYRRIVTYAKFITIQDSTTFWFLNTHFDHLSELSKINSSNFVANLIDRMCGQYPVILTGDFNFTKDFIGHTIITSDSNRVKMSDAQDISGIIDRSGNSTFNGFNPIAVPNYKIDYIFVNKKIKVLSHLIIDDKIENLFPSDHMPILSVINFSDD
jgi:endonuclease/exonuclease/phosphatase family metal-dependent hydrolase